MEGADPGSFAPTPLLTPVEFIGPKPKAEHRVCIKPLIVRISVRPVSNSIESNHHAVLEFRLIECEE